VCQRCGRDRHVQAKRCLLFHRWRRHSFFDATVRCTRCGIPRES
jgi:ribosomal protein L37E